MDSVSPSVAVVSEPLSAIIGTSYAGDVTPEVYKMHFLERYEVISKFL